MAAKQLVEIVKDIVASFPEFLGVVRKVPDFKKSIILSKKPLSVDEVLATNHAMAWILAACAVVTECLSGVVVILSGDAPPIISAITGVLFGVLASTFQAYQVWLIAGKKKGDGYPGPLVIFGTWWLFLIGASLFLLSCFSLLQIVLSVPTLLGVPGLGSLVTIWSIVVGMITCLAYGLMGIGLLHNNKAYPITKLLKQASKPEASRGRDKEKGGDKTRSTTPTPGSKRDTTPTAASSDKTD